MGRVWALSIGGIAAVVALISGPFELPYSVDMPGRAVPRQEWVLVRGPDGQLISTLSDHLRGRAETYEVADFERGDHVSFRLHPSLVAGMAVAAGDTIGLTRSSELERRLSELRGQLNTELASLARSQSGEKESVIQEAQLRLTHARTRAEQQRKEVARLQALFSRDLVAEVDLEIAANTLKLYEIQIDMATAQLHTARTGAREPEVDWIRARIAAFREEIEVNARRRQTAALKSPLSGRFVGALSGDTLAVIQDMAAYVVFLPVPWKDRHCVAPGQSVEMLIDGSSEVLKGRIEYLAPKAHTAVNGQQFLVARALVEDAGAEMAPGLIVRASVACAPVGPLEYLRRFFTR